MCIESFNMGVDSLRPEIDRLKKDRDLWERRTDVANSRADRASTDCLEANIRAEKAEAKLVEVEKERDEAIERDKGSSDLLDGHDQEFEKMMIRAEQAEKERDLARQDAERHLNNWRIATRNAANTRAQEYRADLLQIGAELDRLSVSQCATEGECRCGLCEAKRIAREALEDK